METLLTQENKIKKLEIREEWNMESFNLVTGIASMIRRREVRSIITFNCFDGRERKSFTLR